MSEPRAGFLLLLLIPGILILPVVAAAGTHAAITDDAGLVVILPESSDRIVSLAPSNTEILGALGLMNRTVGVTEYCNYPQEALNKTTVGGFSSVNLEKVVALKPDLILAAPSNGKETVDRLRSLGLTVIVLNPTDIEGVLASIRTVGIATGTESRADSLVQQLKTRLADVRNRTACAGGSAPTVAHVVWYDPIWVSGNGTYQDEVIRRAGGVNAFPHIESWGTVTLEDFLIADPDYILVNGGTGMGNYSSESNEVLNYFLRDARLSQIRAVKENHLILVDSDSISRGGPRIVDAVEQVAKSLHPECFAANVTQQPVATPAQKSPGYGAVPALIALILIVLLAVSGKKARCGKNDDGKKGGLP
ncbi:MAG: cobalamin-binding protein [Methanoregulaceae archaeon]